MRNKNKILLSIIAITALSSSVNSFCMIHKFERFFPIFKYCCSSVKPKYLEVKKGHEILKGVNSGVNIYPFNGCRPTSKITNFFEIAGKRLEGGQENSKDLEEQFISSDKSKKPILEFLLEKKLYVQDPSPCFYIYGQKTKNNKNYFAVICSLDMQDYYNGIVKIHENIIPKRVEALEEFVRKEGAHFNPVLLIYKSCHEIKTIIRECIKQDCEQKFFFSDGAEHKIWIVKNKDLMAAIKSVFSTVPVLYVADGHHRLGVACSMYHKGGGASYRYLLSALIASDNIDLKGFSRVIEDLDDNGNKSILENVYNNFDVKKINLNDIKFRANSANSANSVNSVNNLIIKKTGAFCMFSKKNWYAFKPKPEIIESRLKDPVKRLDVSILHDLVIDPALLKNPKTKVKYLGGDVKSEEIEFMCKKNKNNIGLEFAPVSMDQFMDVVDCDEIMPAKSTWFEPKFPSGLVSKKL